MHPHILAQKIHTIFYRLNIKSHIPISNPLMRMNYSMVDIILNQVTYFSMKIIHNFKGFNIKAHILNH